MIRTLSILATVAVLAAVSALAVSAAFASVNGEWRKTPTPRSLGAADDVGHLSLRKAPPKPLGLDIRTAERHDI